MMLLVEDDISDDTEYLFWASLKCKIKQVYENWKYECHNWEIESPWTKHAEVLSDDYYQILIFDILFPIFIHILF